MIGLAGLPLLTVAVGAAQVGDDRQVNLKKLVIEDDEGRRRIWLCTFPDGQAGIVVADAEGNTVGRVP